MDNIDNTDNIKEVETEAVEERRWFKSVKQLYSFIKNSNDPATSWITHPILNNVNRTDAPGTHERGGKIDWVILKEYLLNNKDLILKEQEETLETKKIKKIDEEIKRLQILNDIQSNRYYNRDIVESTWKELIKETNELFMNFLLIEQPNCIQGLDATAIKEYNRIKYQEIINKLQTMKIKQL